MAVISDEEFHQQALAGGASRHVVTGENPPARGYMVGGAANPDSIPYPEIKRPVDSADLELVRHHARALRDHFGDQANVYQGAWVENGHMVLDASEHHADRVEATTTAKQRGERAVYDIARDRDIDIKEHGKRAKH